MTYQHPAVKFRQDTIRFDSLMQKEIPWHWQDELAWFLIGAGSCTIQTCRRTLRPRTGDAVFVSPGTVYRVIPGEEGAECYCTIFDRSVISGGEGSPLDQKYIQPVIQQWRTEAAAFTADAVEDAEILACMREMAQLELKKPSFYELRIREKLFNLWPVLYDRIMPPFDLPTEPHSARDEQRIKDLLQYLEKHYDDPFDVQAMGEAAGISERETFRVLQRMLDTTPWDFLEEYRIRKAAEMLVSGRAKVTEITEACGFSTPSYFSRTFRTAYGVSPTAFRALYRSGE